MFRVIRADVLLPEAVSLWRRMQSAAEHKIKLALGTAESDLPAMRRWCPSSPTGRGRTTGTGASSASAPAVCSRSTRRTGRAASAVSATSSASRCVPVHEYYRSAGCPSLSTLLKSPNGSWARDGMPAAVWPQRTSPEQPSSRGDPTNNSSRPGFLPHSLMQDPFETSHDLGRTVDKATCQVLRNEFERAARILRDDPQPCTRLFEPYRAGAPQ